jgi:hypothetical protein
VLGSLLVVLVIVAMFTAAHFASPVVRPAMRRIDPAWFLLIGAAVLPFSHGAGEVGAGLAFGVARWVARRVIR